MTQRDLTAQVCTLFCFVLAINQLISQLVKTINQSINLSTNRWIIRSDFINLTDHDRALYLLKDKRMRMLLKL